jgi:hypothetical protein
VAHGLFRIRLLEVLHLARPANPSRGGSSRSRHPPARPNLKPLAEHGFRRLTRRAGRSRATDGGRSTR